MLPPTSVCSEPPIVPKIDRERTVMPRTTPRLLTIRCAVERECRGRVSWRS
jgi:hypothetical protein